jgi:hypothetical protein
VSRLTRERDLLPADFMQNRLLPNLFAARPDQQQHR